MRIGRLQLVVTGVTVGAVAAIAASFATVLSDDSSPGGGRLVAAGAGPVVAGPGTLEPAADCEELLAWYVARGVRRVGPYGWDSPMVAWDLDVVRRAGAAGELAVAAGSPASPVAEAPAAPMEAGESSATGTNVQEAGVDEPDVVKTDGTLLVRVQGGDLATYDVSGSEPVRLGSFDLSGVHNPDLLLAGDRVVVLGHDLGSRLENPRTVVLVIDVADPEHPELLDRSRFTADLVTARQHGDVVRLVMTTALPPLDFVQPGEVRTPGEALRANERVVRQTTLEDWLPQLVDEDGDREPLLDCADVHLPDDEDTALGTLAVVGFDPADTGTRETEGVATASRVAYLSVDRLYVVEDPWLPGWGWVGPPILGSPRSLVPDVAEEWFVPPVDDDSVMIAPWGWGSDDGVTRLHSFALKELATSYVASGEVEGSVADRWAMDEADGVLRVAVGPTQATGGFNSVVTLAEEGDRLVEAGRVDKLGVGEEIKSVRWFDDLAIVVTFRQTDPLYAIDLADPARPRLLGELKIPGFSEYLHPLDSRWMLGIGQDATRAGITRGAQAALFDLADLTAPERVDVVGYGKATQAMAAWDPRQFTWLAEQRTALTVVSDGWGGRTGWVSVLRVGDGELSNRMVEVEYGDDVAQVRLVPLASGKVVLVTGDDVSFFPGL